jgi:two-component system chemotaxis sensor kinase CheA
MDDILRDFLTETSESIEQVDRELVRFERDPDNHAVLANIFRLVHTIKGTCGFLGLNRLEAVSHAAETLMSRLRDGTRRRHPRLDGPHQGHHPRAGGNGGRAGG